MTKILMLRVLRPVEWEQRGSNNKWSGTVGGLRVFVLSGPHAGPEPWSLFAKFPGGGTREYETREQAEAWAAELLGGFVVAVTQDVKVREPEELDGVEVAVTVGIVGLVLSLAALVAVVVYAVKLERRSR